MSVEQKRDVVAVLRTHEVSERRSCQLSGISRCGVHYKSRKANSDQRLGEALKAIAGKHPRYGYRRATVMLRRAGEVVNHKRVARVWRKDGLSLPRRRPRKRYHKAHRVMIEQATRPNEVWTYDFVHDWCVTGQKLKILTVVDEYTRECLATETRTSIKSSSVLAVLERLVSERGAPRFLRSDNGSEFVANRVKEWLARQQIKTLYIEPGSPWQNAVGESFNGRLRDECLNMEWFCNVREARVVIEAWRKAYNAERPHSSLQYQTPLEFHAAYWQEQVQLASMRI